ncbi:MAG: lysine--tRNA ligase [Legionellales bacterium RIFCSPHIGHO2_12_FULL_37_14]|nr:MAG: lysine--tRNA ligase [Legionellales bacterium RIFCSPHIGHO2_12_FULL_37_14]
MIEDEKKEKDVEEVRREKLTKLRSQGFNFPNSFRRSHLSRELINEHGEKRAEELVREAIKVGVAGRIVLKRMMGKASFIHIQDNLGRIQVYVRENDIQDYAAFKDWDLGDIVGIEGELFKTKTGELTIHARVNCLLTKSLKPLPDKFHGLIEKEMCYRKRYVDLIANEETRNIFLTRIKVIKEIRIFMEEHDFLEVETPMMHPIPGGAVAKPFVTHHHALDKPMFLRIAPELYLKRLVVGGFEKVFEINRNFRNEGLSTRHNPEFTMIEFYQAYADYKDLIPFTEKLIRTLCDKVIGSRVIEYQGQQLDFNHPFAKLTIQEAILKVHPELDVNTTKACVDVLKKHKVDIPLKASLEKLQMLIFEETVEKELIQPTFILGYPTEVSPLARRNVDRPEIVDRFELFIAGREIANGFSELNDAEDQAARFKEQVKAKDSGDAEAMHYDSDYIEALEYGLPPTAGEGIGIDRLVMLLTNSPAIRDVILFPQMR